jgi:protein-S-isoprenylcysteine O-methyltransferase Ste14
MTAKDRTIIKAFLGLVFLLGLMWLVLFVPAWTLGYYQAWGFWLIFALSTIAVTIYLLKKDISLLELRTKAGPTSETQISQQIIQGLASILFLMLLIVPGLDHRYHWSVVPFYVSIIGDIVVLLGFIIIFFVFKENSYASGIIETNQDQRVITTGPYRIVRHPMYTGGLLLLLFTPLALGSYWALLVAFLLCLIIVIRLLYEERFLRDHLPGYKEYSEQTRYRLIPRLW